MRKLLLSLGITILLFLIWYLFIKPYDYQVSFSANAFPGTINQTIKIWNESLEDAKIINQKSINSLEQQIIIENHNYTYNWKINLINDSTSKVKVYISEVGNSIFNKITIPFLETHIEQYAEKNVKNFYKIIKEHLNNIKVEVKGESETERTYCVYIPLHTTQIGKANGMMNYYPLLSSFIIENDIQTNGKPIVEISNWDMVSDSLQYNFCFPIIKTDTLPSHEFLKYKWLENTKAIKAVYHGNYITSDRAWYAIMNHAKKNNIEILNTPIEIFYNNPNMGSNEKEWRADIFLPIK
ncbi:MAG: GyrI-like domain-containing protein [Cyclobacteriaceae bacterium]|nr:GyrI-like domain-containing protein [Cyclobacteriaceae bacterium]